MAFGLIIAVLLSIGAVYLQIENPTLIRVAFRVDYFGWNFLIEARLIEIIAVTVVATAFVCWIGDWAKRTSARRKIREKEAELQQTRQQLQRVQISLQDVETKFHDYTVRLMAARPQDSLGKGDTEKALSAGNDGKAD